MTVDGVPECLSTEIKYNYSVFTLKNTIRKESVWSVFFLGCVCMITGVNVIILNKTFNMKLCEELSCLFIPLFIYFGA